MAPGSRAQLEKSTLIGRHTTGGGARGSSARRMLTILYHPCLDRIGDQALLPEPDGGGAALLSRVEPAFAPPGRAEGEPLADEHLSRKPLRLFAAADGGARLELGDSSTAVVVQGKRLQSAAHFSAAQLRRGVVLELGHRVVLLLHASASRQDLIADTSMPGEERELIGDSDGLRQLLWEVRSVADIELPVLIRGENGTGKELIARAIHQAGPRRERPFVAINFSAIPPALASSELFGTEKASFTSAVHQKGYFEQAHSGTLFLDEIGDAPLDLQVALLRVLETGEVQRTGAQVRKVNVRVIAATDADLEAKVATGTFRAPLLNRLSAYEISVPPLRARRDDIGRLLVRFLREELERVGETRRLAPPAPEDKLWLPASLVARLAEYDWPGNIRQLRNVVRQLVIGSRGRDRLELTPAVERLLAEPSSAGAELPEDDSSTRHAARPLPRPEPATPTPPSEQIATAPASAADAPPHSTWRSPADVTENELAEALHASKWNRAAAAKRLGIARASIYVLIERYPRFRTARDLTIEEITRCHRECDGDLERMVERLEVSEEALASRVRDLGLGQGAASARRDADAVRRG
ncbi:sigma 54-interacting transcriptional regulator [Sorangium sp. So ce367]|uniref:sigma 54-interacting transcriptional regulator n=1 Tax=Sorangium sp. So ce367 TaxID=3133305 RepID=UPI003F622203